MYDHALTAFRFRRDLESSGIAELRREHPRIPTGILAERYFVVDVLRDRGKGALLQALDIRRTDQVRPILLKQGRAHTLSDIHGYGIRDRLRHQEVMHKIAAASPMR